MSSRAPDGGTGRAVVVGRQPIVDRERRVVAYELLFREVAGDGGGSGLDGEVMTADVIFGSVSLGLDRVVGSHLAFVNAERGLLVSPLPPVLPPERVVLEVLETVEPDGEVLDGCRRLVTAGYRLALDDFLWFEGAEPLLELASVVKIDLTRLAESELPALVTRCRRFGVRLLAEKVEREAELESCLALGFDYFQGYLLSRPETVRGSGLSPLAASRLRLVASLMGEECDVGEVEVAVAADPAIAHQLLRLAGIGAAHGTRRPVRTLREALVLAGLDRMRSWAALLTLVGDGSVPAERTVAALARARMAELLAEPARAAVPSFAFTAAMVSAFGVLLGQDIEDVLAELPVAAELREAALGGDSPVGRLVADVADYELACDPVAPRTGIDELTVHGAWAAATAWALEAAGVAAPARLPGVPSAPRAPARAG